MYLKRLELRGFKTFAPYTDFVFDEGITAIVGPNGSGKSNIADAVRWVLGEQGFAALRAKRTEDMIFMGTTRRPRLGMAEAAMTLDNSSHWLPLDFAEITVTRRAYRSGENKYFINGSRVLLRDVVDLLGKGGLGRRGFVVIGQGLVDAALSLRAEERRILFEEAAGIHIYREKRQDALNRLAETQQNILRSNDILTEITPRMVDLERQARRAEEYDLLSHDLEKLLRLWYGYQWQRGKSLLMESEALLQHRLGDLELGRARMHEVEALISGTQQRQADLRRQLSTWHKASGELHAEAEVAGRTLAVKRERLAMLGQHRHELQAELQQLADRQSRVREALATTEAESLSLRQLVGTRAARLQETQAHSQRAEAARQELEQALERARERAYVLAAASADARNRRAQIQERTAELAEGQLLTQERIAALEDQLLQADAQLLETTRREQQGADLQAETEKRQHQLRVHLAALEQDSKRRGEDLDLARRQHQRLHDRFEMLQTLQATLAGFSPGAKAVLQARDRPSGVIGPVTTILRVPANLEQAVDAALGRLAHAIVVERWEDGRSAIEAVGRQSVGSVVFLPLDSLSPPPEMKAPTGRAVLGLARDLVGYAARYKAVAQLLLGSVIVVKDLGAALRVRAQLQPPQCAVTLAGERVDATGMISLGSVGAESTLLGQEREQRDLSAQLPALQQAQDSAEAELQRATEAAQACRQDLSALDEEANALSINLAQVRQEAAALQQKRQALQREIDWQKQLQRQQAQDADALASKAAVAEDEIRQRTQEHEKCRTDLEQILASVEESRRDAEAARGEAAAVETELAVAERQIEAQEQILARDQANLTRLEQEQQEKSDRLAELERESNALVGQIGALEEHAESLSAEIGELSSQIEPAERELVTLESQADQLGSDLASTRRRLGELQALHNEQLLERERRHDDLKSLEQRIEDELGAIEYPAERVQQLRLEFIAQGEQVLAPIQVLPESISSDISQLKARLRRLGSVNPDAPLQYRELRQRHDFLKTQISDLEQSAASMHHVVSELDKVMEEEFLSVFNVAAKEFSSYFQTLFDGGKAALSLSDPENPSASGVEIDAQPPGRRPQSLAMLSGGERALTATALLFSVLRARPLPFCLMDEVDAMLDEANVGRFRALLEDFSRQTQFIVITHNRRTIESANTIYGVSMSEEGVSQVLSLRLRQEQSVQNANTIV